MNPHQPSPRLAAAAARGAGAARGARVRTLTAALLLCAACLPAAAAAAPRVTLRAGLLPERLGGSTTIKFAFSIAYRRGETPVPLTAIDLRYPAHLGIATSGLGLTTCRARTLELLGPPGCPSTSVMGYGSGLVEVPLPEENVRERVRLTTFMAPLRGGHLGLLFFADGETPVSAELIFPGVVLPSGAPFGGDLATSLPPVTTWPEGPLALITRFDTTLGPAGITYWEYKRGRYIPYRPRGIRLPRTCPRGGFQFAAAFRFADGANARAHAVVPCPAH